MIKVYESNVTKFDNNGLGTINPYSCIETKKIGTNGWYVDVEANVKDASLIQEDNLILVETKEKGAQPFRITNPQKKDRKIVFRANHVLFDAKRFVLDDVRPTELGGVAYLEWCDGKASNATSFHYSGDAIGTATNYFVRKTLFEAFQQAELSFGALIDANGFQIALMQEISVGQDNGYTVAYGKDIQGVKIIENWDEVCTKILPIGPNELLLPEGYLTSDTQYPMPYTKVISFEVDTQDDEGNSIGTEEQIAALREKAKKYLQEHAVPKISYEVKADVAQDLHIGDTVRIKHPLVTITARVQEYTYNCNTKRVKSITFGNYDSSASAALQNHIQSQVQAAKDETVVAVNKNLTAYAQQILQMEDLIANGMGLFMTQETAANGGKRIYLHNKPTLEESDIIWSFVDGAFSVSTDGGKSWNAGITGEGAAVVNLLSAITINADWIKAGSIHAIDINGSKLTFGDDPNIVTLRTNDEKNGGIFEGQGRIQFKTNGSFSVQNQDSDSKTANAINASNSSAASSLTNNNYFKGVQTNYNNMMSTQSASQYYIGNRFDNHAADRLFMNAGADTHEILMQNYIFGGEVDSSGNVYRANELHMNRTSAESLSILRNYNFSTNGRLSNYLKLYSDASSAFSYLQNNYNGNPANFLWLYQGTQSDKSINYSIWLANRNVDSTKDANGIHLEVDSSKNKISIFNRNKSGTVSNGIYLSEQNETNNYLAMENGTVEGKLANNIYMNYNSGTPYMGLYNRNKSATVLNSIVLGTGSSSDYLNFTNKKPDGNGGNSFNFSAGGSNNWIRISNQQFSYPNNWANTLYWFSTNGGYNAFYLENYKNSSSLGIANRILLASSGSGNSLQLQNFQYSNPNIVNGQITIADSITYQCQNWHNFTFTGGDRQFRISGATHVYINGVDILGKLGIGAQ